MNCPVCKNEPMVVLELKGVEIDYCLKCKGIWLDKGELELLLEGFESSRDVLTSFDLDKKSKEKKRKCPICLKKMEKVLCGRDKKVLIDRCPKGDGLWFDGGELETIISMGVVDKNNKVLELFNDMFGVGWNKGGSF